MKKGIHSDNLRLVCFKDISNEKYTLAYSTIDTDKNITIDGVEYPMFNVEVSSSSHPFYTGDNRIMDSAGRAERFKNRLQKAAVTK